ncbi:hypothetical protein GGR51DRAFT_291576 [Nemania sp. FL0031]|nr:hypothetical protein GGR51DRAFT_291576 [Nemania sp. FL0031]
MSNNSEDSASHSHDADSTAESDSEGSGVIPECSSCHTYCKRRWLLLPCGHIYCRYCLARIFETAIQFGRFPAKCCEPITLLSVEGLLPEALVDRYEEAASLNNTYCHKENCHVFIPQREMHEDFVNCPRCGAGTCTHCKKAAHDGACPLYEDEKEILGLAESMGWRRCNVCGIIVERIEGCSHMICTCGAQFCYDCGRRWNTCSCDYIGPLEMVHQD